MTSLTLTSCFAACGIDSVGIPDAADGGPSGDGSVIDSSSQTDGSLARDTGGDASSDGPGPSDGGPDSDADPDTGADADAGGDADADADANTPPIVRRWNLNGPEYTSIDYPGPPFLASPVPGGICGTNAFSTAASLHGTNDPTLFQTHVYGDPLVCTVGGAGNMLPRGRYKVRLYFSEFYFGLGCAGNGGIGSRVFDVLIEGTRVLDEYDILTESNGCMASTVTTSGRPVIKEFEIEIADGSLNIRMTASADYASLSALEVTGPL